LNSQKIKLSNERMLELTGSPAQNTSTIPMGWFILTPLSALEQNIETTFADYINEIVIIKDYVGKVYLPEWDFNGIGNLTNGYAYQIKSYNDFIIYW